MGIAKRQNQILHSWGFGVCAPIGEFRSQDWGWGIQDWEWFDDLIGIWYVAKEVEAKRTSINRPKGTMDAVAINKVTKKEHKAMLVNEVIPAIKAKFPTNSKNKPIYI